MGQLTNLYVSESYQGLLKLTDSTTGLTSTLQTVQDGLGGNSPLQISRTEVNISGTFTVNGAPVGGVDTGSLMKTGSVAGSVLTFTKGDGSTFNLSVTSSIPSGTISGSQQIIDLGFATTSSVTSLSSSIAATDLSQNNRLTALEGVTGSINRNGLITTGSIGGSQSITGSLNVEGTISATSASFTYVNTVYETASVIYSSGSNQFGDASNDTQTLWGTVNLPSGPLVVTGSVTSTGGFTGSLQGTASYATNAATASIANDLIVVAKNDNPSTLTRGTIVRISGANGDNPLINTASWTDDANSANTLGMLSEDVAPNGFANVVVQGKVIGINTNGMAPGSLLFLSSSGQYTTSSVPAPYHEVRLGQVLRDNVNQGSAYITVDNGYELTELHDVDITNPVDGDLLVYRSGSYGIWQNETGGEIGLATTSSLTSLSSSIASTDLGQNNRLTSLEQFTGSIDTSFVSEVEFGNYTSSNDSKVNSLIAATSSYVTETESGSFLVTGSVAGNVLTFTKGNGTSFNLSVDTGSAINTGSFATTGSNIFKGNQVISGSLIGNVLNNGMIFIGSEAYESGSVKANISASAAISQSNIFFGGLTGPAAANLTGSIVVSGSNNIFMGGPRPNTLVTQGTYGYVNGNQNIINGTQTLNSGSVLRPLTNNNINNGTIQMTFASSSVAGGQPNIGANIINSTFAANMGASGSLTATNNIINGATSLLQTGSAIANLRSTFTSNNINSSFTVQNFVSSSFTIANTNTVGAAHVVNNFWVNDFGTNGAVASRNFIHGQANTIIFSGSPSNNTSRAVGDNFLGGNTVTILANASGSNAGNSYATFLYGYNLQANANATGIFGGSAFVGRFNDTGSLANTNDIVFAVGTGTAAGTRRTGLWIDSGSNVVTSGSFRSIGNVTVTGSLNVSGSATITGSVNGNVNSLTVASNTASLNLNNGNFFELALTGSQDIRIEPSNIKAGQTINIKLNTTGSGTVSFPTSVKQVSGSAYVPSTGTTTDIITLVSFDSTNLYLANVKNLI